MTTEDEKARAWVQAAEIPGYDRFMWRRDTDGYAIRWSDYGDRSSEFGWEIDHITPLGIGGLDHVHNIRARHWRGNASAGGSLGGLLSALRGR